MSSNIYINVSTLEFPLYQGDIRASHPNIGEVFVLPEGYAELEETTVPNIPRTFVLEENTPYQQNGLWYRSYFLRQMENHEIENLDAAEQTHADLIKERMPTHRADKDSPEYKKWLEEQGSAPNVIG
jgi:hypothetical protein